MKPPEPLENTPIFHGKALWTVLERYRICMASQTFVREKLRQNTGHDKRIWRLLWADGLTDIRVSAGVRFSMPKIRCKRGFQAGVDAMGGIELPGIGRMVSAHSSALFHATARAPMQVLGLFFKTRSYCCVSLRYFATPSQNRMRMVAIWARVALPAGFRFPSTPSTMPSATAQAMAGWA